MSTTTTTAEPATTQDEQALDGEFLDYLDSLEGEQEDWTWFGDKEDRSGAENDGAEDESAVEDKGR